MHLPTTPVAVLSKPLALLLLVTMRRGGTVSRTRTGSVLHRFASRLPSGGPCSHQGGFCVLDCIFQEPHLPALPHEQAAQQQQQHLLLQADVDMAGYGGNRNSSASNSSSSTTGGGGTYYIQDVLVWRGYSLVDCGADFRLFWLTSKLAEEVSGAWTLDGGPAGPGHQFR